MCLIAILIWAFILRAPLVELESPWFDEVVTLKHLGAESFSDYMKLVRGDDEASQPLYMVLQYGWAKLFGPGYGAQRWFSIILAQVSLILVFLIGNRLQGATTGLLAALALASSAFHIEYSLEIRVYMLAFVWALLSMYSLFRLLEKQSVLWWSIHLGATLGLIWTHPFGVFLLPVEGVAWFLWGARTWKNQLAWGIAQSLVAATLILWLINASQAGAQQAASWLPSPTIGLNDTSLSVSLIGTGFIWIASADYHLGLTDFRNGLPMITYFGFSIGALVISTLKFRKSINSSEGLDSPFTMFWLAAWFHLC